MDWQSTIEVINNNFDIILGSQSPRRSYLLKEVGLKFSVQAKNTDESFPSSLQAGKIPEYLCEKKSEVFKKELTEKSLVITADTIVWVNYKVLNKPANSEEALMMLKLLSNNTHEVFTGVCLLSQNKKEIFSVRSLVRFKKKTTDELISYINNYSPFDKAGSYGAQECLPINSKPCSEAEVEFLSTLKKGYMNAPNLNITTSFQNPFELIENIEGSYFNVMGLPVVEVIQRLTAFNG